MHEKIKTRSKQYTANNNFFYFFSVPPLQQVSSAVMIKMVSKSSLVIL